MTIALTADFHTVAQATGHGDGLIAERRNTNGFPVGLSEQQSPAGIARRLAESPQATLAKVEQSVCHSLFLQLFRRLVEGIAFANTAQIQGHSVRGQANLVVEIKLNLMTADGEQGSDDSRCCWLLLRGCRLPPQGEEWADCDIKRSLRQI